VGPEEDNVVVAGPTILVDPVFNEEAWVAVKDAETAEEARALLKAFDPGSVFTLADPSRVWMGRVEDDDDWVPSAPGGGDGGQEFWAFEAEGM
jgi:hypothetical protein